MKPALKVPKYYMNCLLSGRRLKKCKFQLEFFHTPASKSDSKFLNQTLMQALQNFQPEVRFKICRFDVGLHEVVT